MLTSFLLFQLHFTYCLLLISFYCFIGVKASRTFLPLKFDFLQLFLLLKHLHVPTFVSNYRILVRGSVV